MFDTPPCCMFSPPSLTTTPADFESQVPAGSWSDIPSFCRLQGRGSVYNKTGFVADRYLTVLLLSKSWAILVLSRKYEMIFIMTGAIDFDLERAIERSVERSYCLREGFDHLAGLISVCKRRPRCSGVTKHRPNGTDDLTQPGDPLFSEHNYNMYCTLCLGSLFGSRLERTSSTDYSTLVQGGSQKEVEIRRTIPSDVE